MERPSLVHAKSLPESFEIPGVNDAICYLEYVFLSSEHWLRYFVDNSSLLTIQNCQIFRDSEPRIDIRRIVTYGLETDAEKVQHMPRVILHGENKIIIHHSTSHCCFVVMYKHHIRD